MYMYVYCLSLIRQEILTRIREYNLYKEAPLDQLKFREVW